MMPIVIFRAHIEDIRGNLVFYAKATLNFLYIHGSPSSDCELDIDPSDTSVGKEHEVQDLTLTLDILVGDGCPVNIFQRS
jgi:hypothetical protein